MFTPEQLPDRQSSVVPRHDINDVGKRFFDSHFHIIDPRFPLVPDQGYMPPVFTVADYWATTANFNVIGGAVVSASFQAFDQRYLVAALLELGPRFVGVTQLPVDVSDEEILDLDSVGVRALRFNLYRGGSENLEHLETMAHRVYDLVGWHVELYIDAKDLSDLSARLLTLPRVGIDHLGLSRQGLPHLYRLVENGASVKASGFGRCDFDIAEALRTINAINPTALLFGTDLPWMRAARPFAESDVDLVLQTLGESAAHYVLFENAYKLYKLI